MCGGGECAHWGAGQQRGGCSPLEPGAAAPQPRRPCRCQPHGFLPCPRPLPSCRLQVYEALGGQAAIKRHTSAIRAWLYEQLAALRHGNGAPLLHIFGRHHRPDRCAARVPAGVGRMRCCGPALPAVLCLQQSSFVLCGCASVAAGRCRGRPSTSRSSSQTERCAPAAAAALHQHRTPACLRGWGWGWGWGWRWHKRRQRLLTWQPRLALLPPPRGPAGVQLPPGRHGAG